MSTACSRRIPKGASVDFQMRPFQNIKRWCKCSVSCVMCQKHIWMFRHTSLYQPHVKAGLPGRHFRCIAIVPCRIAGACWRADVAYATSSQPSPASPASDVVRFGPSTKQPCCATRYSGAACVGLTLYPSLSVLDLTAQYAPTCALPC